MQILFSLFTQFITYSLAQSQTQYDQSQTLYDPSPSIILAPIIGALILIITIISVTVVVVHSKRSKQKSRLLLSNHGQMNQVSDVVMYQSDLQRKLIITQQELILNAPSKENDAVYYSAAFEHAMLDENQATDRNNHVYESKATDRNAYLDESKATDRNNHVYENMATDRNNPINDTQSRKMSISNGDKVSDKVGFDYMRVKESAELKCPLIPLNYIYSSSPIQFYFPSLRQESKDMTEGFTMNDF